MADPVIWGGGDGNYDTAENWDEGVAPRTWETDALAASAVINSGNVTKSTGLAVKNGNSLTLNGGNFTSSAPGNANSFCDGSLTVNGGSLSVLGFAFDEKSHLTLAGGSISVTGGNLLIAGTVSLQSGTFTASNDFLVKEGTKISLSGATLNADYVGVVGSNTVFDFSAGKINSSRFGAAPDSYLNFTGKSTGTLVLKFPGYKLSAINDFLKSGQIRYDGAIDSGRFEIIQEDDGFTITAVP